MFSAFKRLAGKGDGSSNAPPSSSRTPGHSAMSSSLQRKFARGIQYNMKVIIKGDRNVGKTCLFYRLQGLKFIEEYKPTEEIQVTSIQWNYKATDDIVKVEVWDVVDRGKKKKHFDGLKLENAQLEISDEPALDAEFLDVYKGTNGVILVMDITKSWTFDYVQKELPKVPEHIPVIILANHCDMSHHRTVTSNQISFFIESIQGRQAQVRYAESSMRNGFGLKILHKFFNLPFLQLQRETLISQLERNETEITLTTQELDLFLDSDEADYSKFLDNLVNKRRQVADSNSPRVIPTSPQQTVSSPINSNIQKSLNVPGTAGVQRSQSGPIFIGAGQPIPVPNNPLTKRDAVKSGSQTNIKSNSGTNNSSFEQKINAKKSLDYNIQSSDVSQNTSSSGSFMSKLFGNKSASLSAEEALPDLKNLSVEPKAITSVEEFCPDGGQLDRSFLEDVVMQNNPQKNGFQELIDSDSDADTGNPLVAGYQDDLDPDDYIVVNEPSKSNVNPQLKTADKSNVQNKKSSSFNTNKRDSTSSNEQETDDPDLIMKRSEDFDSTINSEISDLTSEAIDTWLSSDSKWRRSPDGGEDISNISQTNDYSGSIINDDGISITSSSNAHTELLTNSKYSRNSSNSDSERTSEKKDKKKSSKEKSEKRHKHKKSSKEKKEKETSSHKLDEKERKRKKRRSRDETSNSHRDRRDELEEFLNGPAEIPIDGAYEAL